MSTDRHIMRTLAALRPRTTVDDAWPSAAREAAYERILTEREMSGPVPPLRQRSSARRIAAGGIATGVVFSAGLGVAGATGVLPEKFFDTFAFWAEEDGVDLATAERVATVPGPDGLLFTVVSMTGGPDDTVCIAPMFETPESASGPVPSAFDGGGGTCGPASSTEPFGSNQGVGADADEHMYSAPAGEAVRAELRLPDGSVYPAVLADGWFYGWFPTDSAGDPVLTGYAADGSVVGEMTITRLL